MPRRLAGSLFFALLIGILSPILTGITANAASAPPAPSPMALSPRSGVAPLADTAASGAGTYLGGSDAVKTFNLPLVRVDQYYDTIIHVSNATATATTLDIKIYDSNGNLVIPTITAALPSWGTFDDDLGAPSSPLSTATFTGSGSVASSVAGISVAVDVTNSRQSPDNLDNYAGIPNNTSQSYFLPFVPCDSTNGTNPTVYLRNLGSSTASVTMTFRQSNYPPGQSPISVNPYTLTVPPQGASQVIVSQVPGILGNNFDAAVQIQSSQPLAVNTDIGAGGGYYTAAEGDAVGTTFYVPRIDFNTTSTWNTGIVMMNAASQAETFTATFYYPDGSQALTTSSESIPPTGVWKLNFLGYYNNTPALPPGFVGSAVVTSSANAVAWVSRYWLGGPYFEATTSYILPATPVSGSWGYLPSLRKNLSSAGGALESTGFALQNTQPTVQNYQIVFWNHAGSQVRSQTIALPPRGMWYLSQFSDAGLPSGFDGSAQIINLGGGPLPLVAVDLDAGTFTPQSTLSLLNFHVFLPRTLNSAGGW